MRLLASVQRIVVAMGRWMRHGLPVSLLLTCAVATAATVTYTYDQYGHLLSSRSDNGTTATTVTYTYDSADNRRSVASATVDTAAPSTPAGLTATAASFSQINLSWSASTDTGGSGLAGYKIFRGGTQIGTSASTTYNDTTVFGSQTYTYNVAAYDMAQNTSAQSAPASATTPPAPDTTAPSVPTGLTASAPSSTQVNLSWTVSTDTGGSGLAGYKVFRAGALIGSTTTTSYSDTTVSGTTTYSYTVAAYDGATPPNVSAQSASAGVTTPDTLAPSVPAGLTAAAPTSNQVNLSWSASTDPGGSGLAGYKIYRGGAQIGTSASTSFTDTTTVGSTAYSYTVAAYDAATPPNVSGQSTAASVTTPDSLAPSVPTGLTAAAPFATQVNLSWNVSTDAGGSGLAGYKIYRGGVLLTSTTATSYTDSTTAGSTTYTYTVRSYDNAGNISVDSAAAVITTPVAWVTITDNGGNVVSAAASLYAVAFQCGLQGGFPVCNWSLNKRYGSGATVWSWVQLPGATCPYSMTFGASGYQQVLPTCSVQASPSAYGQ